MQMSATLLRPYLSKGEQYRTMLHEKYCLKTPLKTNNQAEKNPLYSAANIHRDFSKLQDFIHA